MRVQRPRFVPPIITPLGIRSMRQEHPIWWRRRGVFRYWIDEAGKEWRGTADEAKPGDHVFEVLGRPVAVAPDATKYFGATIYCDFCEWCGESHWNSVLPDDPRRIPDILGAALSIPKLKRLAPRNYGVRFLWDTWRGDHSTADRAVWEARTAQRVRCGDARAAMVMDIDTDGVRIAAYTNELDCVALQCYPPWYANAYGLEKGSRLLACCWYASNGEMRAADLEFGPGQTGRWVNFAPIIAEFLTDDVERCEAMKDEIPEAEWSRAWQLGKRRMKQYDLPVRPYIPGETGLSQADQE